MKGRQGGETPAPAVHQAVRVTEAGGWAGEGSRQQRRREAKDAEKRCKGEREGGIRIINMTLGILLENFFY